ncbi:MAG: hypothetical protein M3Y56_05725 [Armatimonadota bacterium]|nr:hypothetical protein [Armatimonadota bacterium]
MKKGEGRQATLILVCLFLAGCIPHSQDASTSGPTPATATEPAPVVIPADASPWEITSTSPDDHGHAYLGNGYLGFTVGSLGGAEGPANALCLLAGVYQKDALVREPSPAAFTIKLGKENLSASSSLSDYHQTLQLHDGILTTSFKWAAEGKTVPVTITTFASRNDPHLVVVHVSAPQAPGLQVMSALPPIAEAGSGAAAGHAASNSDTAPRVVMQSINVVTGGTEGQTLYVAVQTSDDGPDPGGTATARLEAIRKEPYAKVLADHTAAWHDLWRSDITIEGDAVSQQMIHAALFYLLESTRKGSGWSIPPMGLSNDTWGGHIFWDAPMWMFPALFLLHPDEARPMVDYAARMLPQAKALALKAGQHGASYPWEGARSGGEDAAEPYAQERHVTADTANMAWRYYLSTGDRQWLRETGYPILQATADYWLGRMTKAPDGSMHIRQVVGPDETAGIVDDDAFTNGVVKVNLQDAAEAATELGLPPKSAWKEAADHLWLPFDTGRGIYVPHTGYKDAKLKQADPELLIYPLGLVTKSNVIAKMLRFYPSHISAGGPAMTDSIYATIAARQVQTDDAMKFFRHSYEPFLVPAFDQISEKHSHVRQYCFVTGLGGLVQSVLYGFGGLNTEGKTLFSHPHLPAIWKKLTITGLHFRGKVYDLEAAGETGKLTPGK